MNLRKLFSLLLLGLALTPFALAQIQHVDMRVEGMT